MAWVKLRNNFTEDDRWLDAGADAFAVHVAALCYSDRQLTDGAITAARARRVALARAAKSGRKVPSERPQNDSGCHCTPTTKRWPGISIASITSSPLARAELTTPSPRPSTA